MLKNLLTGITLISLTPDPVSLKSLSLSGSEPKRASALFFKIDFERLCVSPEPSVSDGRKMRKQKNRKHHSSYYKHNKHISSNTNTQRHKMRFTYLLSPSTEAQKDVD